MTRPRFLLWAACALLPLPAPAATGPDDPTPASDEAAPFVLSLDEGRLRWEVPRHERLTYDVEIDIGILGSPRVAEMRLESGVGPYNPGVLVKPAGESGSEMAWYRLTASGEHPLYKVQQTIETSYLPQEFPHIFYQSVQTGTECHKNQLKLGIQDGQRISWYRDDTHCKGCNDRAHFMKPGWPWESEHHCKGCRDRPEHRVWKKPRIKPIDARTVDMVTAVLVARTMIASGGDEIVFPVLDNRKLWSLDVRRGRSKRIEVPAGRFDAIQVLIDAHPIDAKKGDEFKALFGLKGGIEVWVEESTAIPLQISGELPAGPITVGVDARLK